MELRQALLLLLMVALRSRGLKLLNLKVPTQIDFRSPVTLRCEFDLEGEGLYSVKWYKDDVEFFRYLPGFPFTLAFPVPTFDVDRSKSDLHSVTLFNLNFNASGNYRCEVSTEAPKFETVADSSNMTVIALPIEEPVIDGVLPIYSLGDFVSANCTSPRSKPPANLEWHINDEKVTNSMWEYPMGMDYRDVQGLYNKMIGLQFQVNRTHFRGRALSMDIRCTATLAHVVRVSKVSASLATVTNEMLSQEHILSTSGSAGKWMLVPVLLACSCSLLLTS